MLTDEEMRLVDAYAAGIIDGEGSLMASKAPRGLSYARISVHQAEKGLPVLRMLASIYGGKVRQAAPRKSETHAPSYYWNVVGSVAADVLRRVRPYLLIKGEQADLLLCLQGVMGTNHERRKPDMHTRGMISTVRSRISELNARGPGPVTEQNWRPDRSIWGNLPFRGSIMASLPSNGGSVSPDDSFGRWLLAKGVGR